MDAFTVSQTTEARGDGMGLGATKSQGCGSGRNRVVPAVDLCLDDVGIVLSTCPLWLQTGVMSAASIVC